MGGGFECLAGRTFLFRGPVNVGLFDLGGEKAVLVDSGNDDDAGRKLLRSAEAGGFSISFIANTHSHADHCGGNAFLQARTGCGIAASEIEAGFIEAPILEPSYLWGANPLPPLRNKFLAARPSRVTVRLSPPCTVPGTDIQALPLPGHSMGMVGYMTPDKVFFAADTVASVEILDKYHVFYLYNVGAHMATLDGLLSLDANWFVPSHAAPTHDIAPLVAANRTKVEEIAAYVLESCAEPATTEKILARLAARYGIEFNHTQYVLLGSTLRSYLAWLADRGELGSRLEEGFMFFERL